MSAPREPAVVLVRPQEEGNVGAAARAMANMGFGTLVLVEPAVAIGGVARAFAVGGHRVLDRALRVPDLAAALAGSRRVVGTTSARDRDLGAPVLAPRELAAALAVDPPETPTALVFGPEVSGLTNDELARCGLLVRIPAEPAHPTLNLAQAVLIVTYELRLAGLANRAAPRRRRRDRDAPEAAEPPAAGAEVDALFAHLGPLLGEIGFARDDTFEGVLRDLRSLAARAAPTSREVRILRGICRRARHALGRPRPRTG